ncbi:Uncharacterised protein [Sphingobacterium spiritivorum]|uniref:DUF600 domain-containing protein n=1 Tax=Sphingobacterium spiritivorum TaxID=258 RepID=A0A380BPI2_SPHSI|nr:hypothetical protein [Sphingobacterium spiritivorum]SUJ04695.1 Uncharacterised protein [Sphingobacterium spiritivorum]
METIENNINQIVSSTIDNIPTDQWDSCSLTICALHKMIAIKAFYEADGKFISFDPEANGNDITMKIKTLREEMYKIAKDKGAWYTGMFTIVRNGHFDSFFDYDNKPPFKYEPAKDKFLDDLSTFPRKAELMPEWLMSMVKS